MGMGRFNPGCNCCGEGEPCDECDGAVASTQYDITIAGITDGGCNWSVANGTYTVDLGAGNVACPAISDGVGNRDTCCNWVYEVPDFFDCSGTPWNMFLCFTICSGTDGHWRLGVCMFAERSATTIFLVKYETDLGTSAPDCLGFSSENLPYHSSGLFVTTPVSSSTCAVSSV